MCWVQKQWRLLLCVYVCMLICMPTLSLCVFFWCGWFDFIHVLLSINKRTRVIAHIAGCAFSLHSVVTVASEV